LTLRDARPDEASALSDLAVRSKAYWGYSPAFMAACRAELTYTAADIQRDCFVVVGDAERGGVVGFYALERLAGGAVELGALFVEPSAIGRGYGRALLEDAKARASRMGAACLVIQGDPHAEAFYRAAGATIAGTTESASIPGRFLPTFVVALRRVDRGA
jgi:GNAT superfamily N-acetyltransferase